MKKKIAFMIFFLLLTVTKAQQTGMLNDIRDGKVYKTVKIDNRIWMAQNLNFIAENGSWCYDDDLNNCDKYGRLYDWETSAKICPEGWHLPTEADYEALIDAVNNDGNALKSKGQGTEGGAGTNTSGFSALLAGLRYGSGLFSGSGLSANFWCSAEYESSNAYFLYLFQDDGGVFLFDYYKEAAFSVRCVKD